MWEKGNFESSDFLLLSSSLLPCLVILFTEKHYNKSLHQSIQKSLRANREANCSSILNLFIRAFNLRIRFYQP